ncbi:MAG: WYL domain-containing protein [Candidatus Omnitrophica bacterium]|nr:WYL domain-containing protein [Candidatus Omnitrophota bacterium]
MNSIPRLVRLKRLFEFLRSGEAYLTAPTLAERLEVSVRTVYRDIQSLADLGVQIDGERGYRAENPDFLPFIQPNASDLHLIQQLIDSCPLSQFPDFQNDCRQLITKLEFLITENRGEDNVFQYSEPQISDRLAFSHEELERACNECRVCEMSYQALDETAPSIRIIHPYGVAIRIGQWYLIALDEAKNEFRLYHFLRIKALTILDRLFTRDASFQFSRFFEDSWNVFQGKKQIVRFRAEGIAARLISERTSPRKMETEWIGPQEVKVSMEIRGEQEIVNWALSMGPQVEILEPESLREKVRQLLSHTLRLYKNE